MRLRVLLVLGFALAAACGGGKDDNQDICSSCSAEEAQGKVSDSCNEGHDSVGAELQCVARADGAESYRCASRTIPYACDDGVYEASAAPARKLCSPCTQAESASAAADQCQGFDDGSDDDPAGAKLRCKMCDRECQSRNGYNEAQNPLPGYDTYRCASEAHKNTACVDGIY